MEYNGYYDDDGNQIHPENLPKPGLCIICKKNTCDDSEEEMLCNLNRLDQRNDEEFICGAFEKIE